MMTCHECIHKYCCKYDRFFGVDAVEDKCAYFKNKADYAEVKHGEWERKIKNGRPRGLKCSLCGRRIHFHENYCPDCGAKMEGVIHNG